MKRSVIPSATSIEQHKHISQSHRTSVRSQCSTGAMSARVSCSPPRLRHGEHGSQAEPRSYGCRRGSSRIQVCAGSCQPLRRGRGRSAFAPGARGQKAPGAAQKQLEQPQLLPTSPPRTPSEPACAREAYRASRKCRPGQAAHPSAQPLAATPACEADIARARGRTPMRTPPRRARSPPLLKREEELNDASSAMEVGEAQ